MGFHWRLLRRVADLEGRRVPTAALADHCDLTPGVFEVQCLEDGCICRVAGRDESEIATAVALQNWYGG